MAARIRKVQLTDAWKQKIKVAILGGRLYDHVNGKVEMSNTQVKAAQILLAKLVPDLARTESTISGPDGDPIKHAWTVEMVRPK